MLMRAGTILPLAPAFAEGEAAGTVASLVPGDSLAIAVYPGADGAFRLYEDDGVTEAYKDGEAEWTEIRNRPVDARTWEVHVAPVEGRCSALPAARSYEICFAGSREPDEVLVDGAPTEAWTYDEHALTTVVSVPARDKAEPLTVSVHAEEAVSALGTSHNADVIAADVARLLGDASPDDVSNVDAVLALPEETPGRAEAVARLGGPFAVVREYVTPEEAAQQLGRVIVAPPQDGSPYDARVTFTRERGADAETQLTEVTNSTERQIVDAPFAFAGEPWTQRWTVQVDFTWRGVQWTRVYHSAVLFPTITAWRAVAYPKAEAPGLDAVLTAEGAVNPALDWQAHVQNPDDIPNYKEPHAVLFWRDYEELLRAKEPLVGYVTGTVVSPEARDAVLEFRTTGEVEIYLNGELVPVLPHPDESHLRPTFRSAYRTEPLPLREGENVLLIRSVPLAETKPHWWYFGARFVDEDGELMLDLDFRE
jgi:hypothetical protein